MPMSPLNDINGNAILDISPPVNISHLEYELKSGNPQLPSMGYKKNSQVQQYIKNYIEAHPEALLPSEPKLEE